MTQLGLKGFYRPSAAEWIATGAALAAVIVYLLILRALDHRAERYFQNLRESDPVTYLTQLREAKGFAAYLPEYTKLNGYDDYRPHPPSFLVGRWTIREEPLRLTHGQAPATCPNPATFDYGLFLTVESGGVALPVQYRLNGDVVEMRTRNDSVFPIKLISYGAQLDHVEFTPPGHKVLVYGYLCGR